MKLDLNQIKNITCGAVRIEEENGGTRFYRFTEEQEHLYKITNEDFYNKTFATAGIKLSFKTNSNRLGIRIKELQCVSRKYFSFDVFVDGKPIGYIDNFSHKSLPRDYTLENLEDGDFSGTFDMVEGEKTICIYLPWSAKFVLDEISLEDGAYITPVKPEKKILVFGDSITQGYDALRPSMRYVSKLAEAIDAEEFNKAIGGEIFFPDLAEIKDYFTPDYIAVAYGTNDWNVSNEETFKYNCRKFYKTLSENYKNSKIFAITPIWRKELNEYRPFGKFEKIAENIKQAVNDLENVTVISGFDFVPKDEKYFADLRLHPNDEGFDHYFKKLFEEIKKALG